jgi:hypothetical protein
MSGEDEERDEGGIGSTVKLLLLIAVTVLAGILGFKLLMGALKTILVLAVVGGVGYLGYSLISNKLLSSDDDKSERAAPKLLESKESEPRPSPEPRPAPEHDTDEALRELKEAMKELDDLKKLRDE